MSAQVHRRTLLPNGNQSVEITLAPHLEREWIQQRIIVYRIFRTDQKTMTTWFHAVRQAGIKERIPDTPWFDIYDFNDGQYIMNFPFHARDLAKHLVSLGDNLPGVTALVVKNPIASTALTQFFMEYGQGTRPRRMFNDYEAALHWVKCMCDQQYNYLALHNTEEF